MKGKTIYGLCFLVDGKRRKILASLEAPEAEKILRALKALGVDVPDDPKLQKKVAQVRESRGDSLIDLTK